METAAPATLVGRIIAVLAIAVVALAGLPVARVGMETVAGHRERSSTIARMSAMT